MDYVEESIADLLVRVRQNDEASARQLVERLYPLVIRIVRAHLPRRASEEELAQDIFVKMFASLDDYRSAAPFEHWVSRIAVNHCRNAIRARLARPEWRMADLSQEQVAVVEAARSSACDLPHPTQAMTAKELVEMLLGSLPPQDRLLIRLLEMEDRSVEEIRQLTGWPATLIRLRAFRARRKLNQRFGRLRKEGKL